MKADGTRRTYESMLVVRDAEPACTVLRAILRLYRDCIRVILGYIRVILRLCKDYIRVIMRLY